MLGIPLWVVFLVARPCFVTGKVKSFVLFDRGMTDWVFLLAGVARVAEVCSLWLPRS